MTTSTILITGASTGIGFAAALHWARQGHRVYAGVRKAEDAERLRQADSRITPLFLDVTKDEQIDKALAEIRSKPQNGPFCLVNNAGVAMCGPLEAFPIEKLYAQLEINFFGPAKMIQKFLPLIRETQGRIVNVSSIAGRVAIPFFGPYAASKFALEGMTDSLRRELHPLGVKVILIEPGPIATPLWQRGEKLISDNLAGADKKVLSLYESAFNRFLTAFRNMGQHGDPVTAVLAKFDRALFSQNPKPRYLVGREARLGAILTLFPSRSGDRLLALLR